MNLKQQARAHVLRALQTLVMPGAVVEIRAIDVAGNRGYSSTVSGYFQDLEAAADAAVELDGKCPAVYFTLNTCNPALLARASNRVRVLGKKDPTTGDPDIDRRVWLPIDIDPVRPSGVSSTDSEHEAAHALVPRVTEYLAALGWSRPVIGDSGNGAHILYRIDLPNDKQSADLVKRVLVTLADRFDTDTVKIDRGNFNAARIWKLYGTAARKGDNTPTRPHRRAKLL